MGAVCCLGLAPSPARATALIPRPPHSPSFMPISRDILVVGAVLSDSNHTHSQKVPGWLQKPSCDQELSFEGHPSDTAWGLHRPPPQATKSVFTPSDKTFKEGLDPASVLSAL